MKPIEALDFAIGVSRHRANKLRGAGQMSRAVLDRIRQHEDAADALQGLRDQVATRTGRGEAGREQVAHREVGRGAGEDASDPHQSRIERKQ